MNWYGTWKNGLMDSDIWFAEAIDLTKIPCATAWGVSDCWPCYILPEFKETLRMTIELWINGRTTAEVYSAASWCGMHSLSPEHLSCSWWPEKS
jgi:hypothetical protein